MKVCTKCGIEKDENNCGRDSKGYFNGKCKKCRAIEEKERRLKNPEKALSISRENYKKYGQKQNQRRKEKYHSDIEYRRKKLERDKRYTLTGKRNEQYYKNREVNLKRISNYRKNNKDKINKRMSQYRKDVWNKKEKANRANLKESYVIRVIQKQIKYQLRPDEVPIELVNIKKATLEMKRTIKNKIKQNGNTNTKLRAEK